ncbi:hypothetical protein [Leptobacterium sp. I13]|uniref:hypothetical protein n=1 Tax=Leptobacterium meishanense TaxID=3128904 RepID=UPI0030EB7FAB
MKNSLFFLTIALIILSCNQKPKKEVVEAKKTSLDGVWELVDHYSYTDNVISDTTACMNGYRQVKIYTGGKVMWSRKVPLDSTEWYGYGSYQTTDSTLTETLEYGSASMLKIIDTMRVFSFDLELGDDYYRQINTDGMGNRLFSENYRRIK